jgi:hypothetical protein
MIRVPPEITFEKRPLSGGGWCYDFHHCTLGALGRILLREMPDGRSTHVSCELAEAAGDPASPRTMQRRAVFEPLGLEIARQMEQVIRRRSSGTQAQNSPHGDLRRVARKGGD